MEARALRHPSQGFAPWQREGMSADGSTVTLLLQSLSFLTCENGAGT